MRFIGSSLLVMALCVSLAFGCGEDPGPARDAGASDSTGPAPGAVTQPNPDHDPGSGAHELPPLPCPAGAGNCASASGTILYVERVDPDGDGDAHFVLLSSDGVTAPGITVVDVRRGLRPSRLPGPGDSLSAQGPVFTGSYGQRQIQANAIRVGG